MSEAIHYGKSRSGDVAHVLRFNNTAMCGVRAVIDISAERASGMRQCDACPRCTPSRNREAATVAPEPFAEPIGPLTAFEAVMAITNAANARVFG